MEKKEWYREWFNSPYYDLLYRHRDEKEAEVFIKNLVQFLNLKPHHKILDLACGKGRHSITLNKLGLDVIGVDLSPRNIAFAKKFENDRLRFEIGDMREVVKENHFTHVLNLFTSFGYFSNHIDNQKVIESVYQSLKPKGVFVLDFLNTESLSIDNNNKEQFQTINNVTFKISKRLNNNSIVKSINIIDGNKQYCYCENVTAFSSENLQKLINTSPLEITEVLGNYHLKKFNGKNSDRVIFISNKKGE